MNLDGSGVPTDAAIESEEKPAAHRFGEFVVPAESRVKGFSDFRAFDAFPAVWVQQAREQFRAR